MDGVRWRRPLRRFRAPEVSRAWFTLCPDALCVPRRIQPYSRQDHELSSNALRTRDCSKMGQARARWIKRASYEAADVFCNGVARQFKAMIEGGGRVDSTSRPLRLASEGDGPVVPNDPVVA